MSAIHRAAVSPQEWQAGRSWPAALFAGVRNQWRRYLCWRIERAVIEQLYSMSDRQLKDIGISRSEIVGAVKGHVRCGR